MLDGGRKKWELDGRPLSTDTVTLPATTYTAAAPNNAIRAFRDEAVDATNVKNLVDVRSPDEFSGKILAPAHLPQEQSQVPGHIPGAINVPWSKAANEDGTFKSDDELTELYAEAGLDGQKETIAYCRIGERSSHTWFVLQESCWGTRTSRTTTAAGPSTVRWSASRSSSERQVSMCAAPKQGQQLPAGVDVEKETVLTGQVTDTSGAPVPGAFVRLLDSGPVSSPRRPTSGTGDTWFFAAPGNVGASRPVLHRQRRCDRHAGGPRYPHRDHRRPLEVGAGRG